MPRTVPSSTPPTDTPWLTPRQAAARAQCGLSLLYHAIKIGKLKAVRLGVRNELRIHTDWIDAWMGAQLVNPDAPGSDDVVPFRSPQRLK